jgi:hypothetical protein
MTVFLTTQEAMIRKMEVQSQPRQIVRATLSRKDPSQRRAGGVAQGVGLRSNPIPPIPRTQKKKASPFNIDVPS